MQYSLGMSLPRVITARHFAKRAPSSRYSFRRSRSPSRPSVTVSPSASASGFAPVSTLIPGTIPFDSSNFGKGVPSAELWRIVSSKRMTPPMYSSAPSVVKRRSVSAPRLFVRLDANRVEAFLDRAAALVRREDSLAVRDDRLGGLLQLLNVHVSGPPGLFPGGSR